MAHSALLRRAGVRCFFGGGGSGGGAQYNGTNWGVADEQYKGYAGGGSGGGVVARLVYFDKEPTT